MVFGVRLRHRGPDWSGLFVNEEAGVYLAHERLAIIDPASGDQPLFNESKEIVVAVRVSWLRFLANCCFIIVEAIEGIVSGVRIFSLLC